MHGLLRCNINTGVRARGRSRRVTQRCHNSSHWKWGYGVWVTSRTGRARRIWGDFEKVNELRIDTGGVEMRPASGKDGWFSLASGELCGGCHTCWGGGADEKARIERMCISLPYVETFNSKVIKYFVPEQRSRYVFFEFQDSYVLYIYIYMNIICPFHT